MDPCYISQSYASTYEHYFMPMIDKRSWPQYTSFELRHDPDQIRGKVRPKSRRIANGWMRVERNELIVVVVGAKVTILEPVTPGNMLYILY